MYQPNNYKIGSAKYQQDYRRHTKIRLMKILGQSRCVNPNCRVPGGMDDIRCLQFDHKKGSGTQERYRLRREGTALYRYYILHPNEAKEDLQLFCANCNWIKRHKHNEHSGKTNNNPRNMKRKILTEEVLQCKNSGMTVKEIARKFNVSRTLIMHRLYENNLNTSDEKEQA